MTESPPEWELSKENILPLSKGRKMSSLRAALCPRSDEKQMQKQAFEDELRTYSGEDPLEVWYSYIQWVEQNYPKGGVEGNIRLIVENCITILAERAEYHNDKRFIEIWIKYANMNTDATEIYDYMYSNRIGCELSMFYESWAWMLESTGNSKRADAVLCEGIQRKAQPLETLLNAQRQLQLRVGSSVKQMLNDEAEETPAEECRTVLSSLQLCGKKSTAPISRVGPNKLEIAVVHPKAEKDKNTIKKQAFQIYSDENSNAPSHLPCQNSNSAKVVPSTERMKENDIKPKKWSNSKIPSKPPASSSKKTFEIYEDKKCTEVIRKVPLMTNVLSTRMNWKDWRVPVALFELPDPKKIPMYDKQKVYAGGEEFSFEEIRAARLLKEEKANAKKNQETEQYKTLQNEIRQLQDQFSSIRQFFCASGSVANISKVKSELQSVVKDSRYGNEIEKNTLPTVPLEKNCKAISDAGIVSPAAHAHSEYTVGDHADHMPASNDSSSVASHTSAAESEYPTLSGSPQMNEAMSLLRGAWYQSTLDVGHSTEDLSKAKEISEQGKKFTIYQDPPSTVNQYSIPLDKAEANEKVESSNHFCTTKEAHRGDSDDDLQNKPPKGYVQEKIKRPLSGILQPSVGIPVKDHTNEESEDDYDDVVIVGDGNDAVTGILDNVTVSAEKFAPNSHFASTPFQGAFNSGHLDDNTATDIEKDSMQPKFSRMGTQTCITRQHISENLSAITEGSYESSSKSSSSSSSCATTHSVLSANRMQHSSVASGNFTKNVAIHRPNVRKCETESCTQATERHISVFPTDIDPFDINVTQNILSNLRSPVSERPNYTKVNEVIPVLRILRAYQFGKEKYTLLRHCAQGAYAKIYTAHKEASMSKFALKVSKPFNEWEFYICSELWQRLNQLDAQPNVSNGIVFVDEAIFFKDGGILVSKFGEYGTLVDIRNLYKKNNKSMPESLVMCFALELLHIIRTVHQCQIIHADVKPDNLLVINLNEFASSHVGNQNKCGVLRLIDFGRSIDMKQYSPGTAFTTVINTSGFKCTEMLEGKPWTFQTDWFGVVGTIHTLLFGEYMKVQNKEGYWDISSKFKRYWDISFWQNLFHTLLNIPGCDRIPDVSPFIAELTKKIQQPSMCTEIKKQGVNLYVMQSESSKF